MIMVVSAHEIGKVRFIPHVSSFEVCDGLCHIEGDKCYDVDDFPISDLIAVSEEVY